MTRVFREKKPLDEEGIRRSRTQLFIGVTNAATGRGEFVDTRDTSIDIITALRASAALPVVYNRKIRIKGVEYCDATTGCALPIDFATEFLHCTDILVVLNRPFVNKEYPPPLHEKLLIELACSNFSRQYRHAHIHRNQRYNKSLDILRNKMKPSSGINVDVIYPPEALTISRLCTDRKELQMVAQRATKQTTDMFAKMR